MSSIHERLQNLEEARQLEASVLKSEREEHDRAKKEKYDTELLRAKREQYAKLTVLKDAGILEMIADATGTSPIRPEWPLSDEEKEERRQAESQRPKVPMPLTKRDPEDFRGRVAERLAREDEYWQVGLTPPCVTSELEWNTDVAITAIKYEKKFTHRAGPARYSETAKVTTTFDGSSLNIKGSETTFSDYIPDGSDRQEVLEEAFVQAFDKPQDMTPAPNRYYHTHPEFTNY